MRSQKSQIARRRLRLELLENRSLLTAAPWIMFQFAELEFEGLVNTTAEGEMAHDCGVGASVADSGDRASRDGRWRPRLNFHLHRSHSSLDDLASGEGEPSGGMGEELQADLGLSPEPSGEPPAADPPMSNEMPDMPGSGDDVMEMPLSGDPQPPSPERVMAFASPQDILRRFVGSSANQNSPSTGAPGGGSSIPRDAQNDVVRPGNNDLAIPIVESGAQLLFDSAQPNQSTDPQTSFLKPPYSSPVLKHVDSSSLRAVGFEAGVGRDESFDLAINGLDEVLEAQADAGSRPAAELDDLLQSLADEQLVDEQLADEQLATIEETEVVDQTADADDARQTERNEQGLMHAGGMIALDLPHDLLLGDWERMSEDINEAGAWTSRVGMYRAHEVVSARGGVAANHASANGAKGLEIRETEVKNDDIVNSRFRPIAAVTSAAFGAIVIGLRKQRDRVREQYESNRKLH